MPVILYWIYLFKLEVVFARCDEWFHYSVWHLIKRVVIIIFETSECFLFYKCSESFLGICHSLGPTRINILVIKDIFPPKALDSINESPWIKFLFIKFIKGKFRFQSRMIIGIC